MASGGQAAPNPSALLIEAAALGDDSAVSQILSDEQLLTVEEAAKADTRLTSKYFGLTALHRAKTPEVARVLLDFGVPVDCKGAFGQTALHTCCKNPALIKLLLERGADINARTDDGSTALEWAVVADTVESAKVLLEQGADVQATNSFGNTPLHLVTSKRMAELLLAFGAKVSVENTEGKIPLETAAERKGDPDLAAITELLLEVSEDRGLRYRMPRSGNESSPSSQLLDSFRASKIDKTTKVKARWAMVRQRFLHAKAQKDDPSAKDITIKPTLSLSRNESTTGSTASRLSYNSMHVYEGDDGDPATDAEESESDDDDDTDEPEQAEHSGFYKSFFEMAIRERPFLAMKMLDRQRTFLYSKGNSKYYMYDLSLLGGIDSVSDALRLIVECDQRELVAHDVVQWLVTAKWGLFVQNYLIHEAVSKYQTLTDIGLLFLSFRYMYRLVLEWRHRGATREVASSIFRADKFTGPVFVLVGMILALKYYGENPSYSTSIRVLETIACVMLWIRLLYFAEPQFQSIGLTMSIVRKMISDIIVYLLILFVFLLGFSHAMTVAFRDDDRQDEVNENFGSPIASFTTLLFFIFSMDQSTVMEEQDSRKRILGMILLAMYETLVVIVFLNLVIAVMTTSFEDVMSNARTEWLLVRAKICVKLEDQTSAWMRRGGSKEDEQSSIKRRKKSGSRRRVIVVEHASGENEVSLPLNMLPAPSRMDLALRQAWQRVKRWLVRSDHDDYEAIPDNEERSLPRSIHSRPTLAKAGSIASTISGKSDDSLFLGTFTRFSTINRDIHSSVPVVTVHAPVAEHLPIVAEINGKSIPKGELVCEWLARPVAT